MKLTKHGATRQQQRAIPQILIDLLLQFGTSVAAGAGASKVFFDKSARRRLKTYAGPLASQLDQHLDLYAVVASDSSIITVAHRINRIRRH